MVDLTGGRLPALVHWGAELGDPAQSDAATLIEAGVSPVGSNLVDEPVRLSLLPEHWTGWVGRPGITGSRAGRAWSPQFSTTSLLLNGRPPEAGSDPRLVIHDGPALLEVRARDETAQLDLTIRLELTTGGLLRSQVELTNRGAEYALNDCVLAYPVPPVARELLDLAGRWAKERIPQRQPWRIGAHLREGRKGRTGADAATLLHAGEPGFTFSRGEIWAVHVGWSGNHTHYAERVSTGEQVIGGGELLLPGEIVLGPDEAYTSPWLYGSYGVGLDEVAQRFHRYLRSRPTHPSAARPVTINVWEAVYFDHDLGRLTDLAKAAARVGIERYVLDDGWFGQRRRDTAGLGDWTVSPDVWPHGLHPLVDTVKDLGMEFGLWFEPEMVNLDSDVARAHPEWVMSPGGRLPIEARNQQVINLGIPECYAYIRNAIFAILDEYEIDYIKWDHNRDLLEAGDRKAGTARVHAQTRAVYALMDELRRRHPDLEVESCSSGGGRVDLEVLQRSDRVWASDCIDGLERQHIQRWTGLLLPPELVGSHIGAPTAHTTHRTHSLAFRAATALFGHFGIEWDLRTASADELVELAAWVRLYKQERSLVHSGTAVHSDYPDDTYWSHGYVSQQRDRAIFAFVALQTTVAAQPGRIRLPGLSPQTRYRIEPVELSAESLVRSPTGPPPWWTDPPTVTGQLLGTIGLQAPMLYPEQALLVRLTALDGAEGAR
jgi:alpha-galactosidase